jgi:hypothetical protein
LNDLKQSTRQRFVALEFDYPEPAWNDRYWKGSVASTVTVPASL